MVLLRYVYMSSKLIKELVRKYDLDPDEAKVLEYFIRNISVGEILAIRELTAIYHVREPLKVIIRLIKKGVLTKGLGCYNLSNEIRKLLKSR